MPISDLPYLLLITAFCFMLRIYPRLKLRNGLAADTFAHLKYAEILKKSKFAIGSNIENSIIQIEYSYPYLYHWVLSFFSSAGRLWAERATGAFFDSVNVVIGYLFFSSYLDYHQLSYPGLALLVSFLYCVSPALLRFNGGPRSFNGSPRIMGQTLYLLNIFFFYLYITSGSYWCMAFSIISGGLILIGSTFGTQVYVFFGIIIGLFFDTSYFLVLPASFIFILLISKFKVIKVLKGHFGHVRFLSERLKDPSLRVKDQISYFRFMFWALAALKNGDFKKAAAFFHERTLRLHSFLFYYPSFFIIFKFSYFQEHKFLYMVTLAALVMYILTSLKPLKFLGEAVRYLDYAIFPSYLLSMFFLYENDLVWIFYVFTGYALFSLIYFVRHFIETFTPINNAFPEIEKAFEFLNNCEKGNVFVFNSSGHLAFYLSKFPIINVLLGNLDVNKFPKADSDLVIGNYPLPGNDINAIIKRYLVNYIIITRGEQTNYTDNFSDDKSFFTTKTDLIYECGPYLFLKVK